MTTLLELFKENEKDGVDCETLACHVGIFMGLMPKTVLTSPDWKKWLYEAHTTCVYKTIFDFIRRLEVTGIIRRDRQRQLYYYWDAPEEKFAVFDAPDAPLCRIEALCHQEGTRELSLVRELDVPNDKGETRVTHDVVAIADLQKAED